MQGSSRPSWLSIDFTAVSYPSQTALTGSSCGGSSDVLGNLQGNQIEVGFWHEILDNQNTLRNGTGFHT
jgi:hypothetical protein